ncbi:unnamed protein product, partial [Heterosigma akashiwo]
MWKEQYIYFLLCFIVVVAMAELENRRAPIFFLFDHLSSYKCEIAFKIDSSIAKSAGWFSNTFPGIWPVTTASKTPDCCASIELYILLYLCLPGVLPPSSPLFRVYPPPERLLSTVETSP